METKVVAERIVREIMKDIKNRASEIHDVLNHMNLLEYAEIRTAWLRIICKVLDSNYRRNNGKGKTNFNNRTSTAKA